MVPDLTRRQTLLALSAASLAPIKADAGQSRRKGAAPSKLLRGYNLPDQAPRRADQIPEIATLRMLYRLGMTHVRLPVVAEFVLPPFSGPATIASTTDDLKQAIETLLEIGYCVSVDMHPGADFQNLQRREAAKAHAALLAGWRQLSEPLSHWPAERIFIELLNEPATTDDIWRPFAEALAIELRTQLPKNIIIVGPAPFQRSEMLASWPPFADKDVVYAFHYYDPMIFTHQGAVWDKNSTWARMADIPFPSEIGDPTLLKRAEEAATRGEEAVARDLRTAARQPWTPATIMAQFERVAAWSAEHSAPVIVNEFGVLKWKSRRADRLAWIAAVRAAAEANGFGWAHWDYSTSFGLLNEDRSLDRGVIHALLGA